MQTWFQNHRSRAKQSLRRTVKSNGTDASTTAATVPEVREKTLSESVVVVKPVVHRRKRATDNVENCHKPETTTTPKRRHVSPPGELDQTSADLMRPLANRRQDLDELQTPVLKTAAAAGDGDGIKATGNAAVTKKIRYFSNFYRQPEPGEVFVGARLQAETFDEMQCDQSTNLVSWMNDGRPYSLPPNLPFPLNFMTQPLRMTALSLHDPSSAAVWGGHRPFRGTLTSFPPSLCHVMAYDVAETSL